jgi:polygalacturonase
MSLTKVTYSMINGPVINAYDYGAVGDGVVDDTSALELFFAAVSGRHGILPAGTYKITSRIELPTLSNCTITGVPGQPAVLAIR